MIIKSTLEQTFPLAQSLAAQGITLNVLQGTPLAEVMATCSTYGLHVEGQSFDTITLDTVADYLVDECKKPLTQDFIPHNAATNKVIEEAAKACSAVLSFAKNVVVADVKEMLDKVEAAVNGIKSARSEPFVIQAESPSTVFSNPLLHELVDRYNGTVAKSVDRVELGFLDPVTVRSSIVTGAATFDEEVSELLSRQNSFAYDQVSKVLEGSTSLDDVIVPAALGVHLACKALYDNPFEGCKLSLIDYNLRMANLMEQSGRIVCKEIEQIVRRRQLLSLYNGASFDTDTGKTIISVNNDVYLDLLGKGLSPEALIGNEFLGRRFNPSQLIENVEMLQDVYKREINLRLMQASMEETNSAREAIVRLYALEIVNREDDQLPVDRGTLQKRLSARVALIGEQELLNLPILIRDLTCHVFYAHTDAHTILSSMDIMGARHVDMNPREVILLVTVEYIAIWVAKQMVVA